MRKFTNPISAESFSADDQAIIATGYRTSSDGLHLGAIISAIEQARYDGYILAAEDSELLESLDAERQERGL